MSSKLKLMMESNDVDVEMQGDEHESRKLIQSPDLDIEVNDKRLCYPPGYCIKGETCKRGCLRYFCMTSLNKERRPTIANFAVMAVVSLICAVLLLLPMALLTTYFDSFLIKTNYTIQDYHLRKSWCTESTFPSDGLPVPTSYEIAVEGRWNFKGINTNYAGTYIIVCYDGVRNTMNSVKTKYPLGSSITNFWCSPNDPSDYSFYDNLYNSYMLIYVVLVAIGVFATFIVIHFILVLFCGFESMRAGKPWRIYDPYRRINI